MCAVTSLMFSVQKVTMFRQRDFVSILNKGDITKVLKHTCPGGCTSTMLENCVI